MLQARQSPVQKELQQTPSTQLPLGHWHVLVHEVPTERSGSHVVPEQ
jgi:hypothetical protein